MKRPSKSPAMTERRSQRQRAIIETASALFAESDYANCDMDRLANELGIAKGTIYLYFPTKQDLFFACVDFGMRQMQLAVQAAADEASEPFDRIARAVRAYLTFFAEHPQLVELLIQERAIFKDRKRPTYFEHRDAARVQWREFYQSLIDAGRLRSDLQVEAILDTIGNLVYGTMFTNHFIGPTESIDEQLHRILNIVLLGIASDGERQSISRAAARKQPNLVRRPRQNGRSGRTTRRSLVGQREEG